MVTDNINNAHLYYSIHKNFKTAFEFLRNYDPENVPPGKYEIDGSEVYAMVQNYQPKPQKDGKWEAHRKYIDIQYVAGGSELMGYAYAGNLEVSKEYDADADYLLFDGSGSFLSMNTGTFMILYPGDAHMPCLEISEDTGVQTVDKIVVKVLL